MEAPKRIEIPYTPPEITEIPAAQFIMLDGQGSPDAYPQCAAALRNVAHSLGVAHGPLEGLWWTADGKEMSQANTDEWRWTVMLRLSDEVTAARLKDAVEQAEARTSDILSRKVYAKQFKEGVVVQVLYTGSLRDKQPVLDAMLRVAESQGYEEHGAYHEIYFHDPGPGTPPDAQTLLRQPVRKKVIHKHKKPSVKPKTVHKVKKKT